MKRNDYGDEYEPRIESGYVSIRTPNYDVTLTLRWLSGDWDAGKSSTNLLKKSNIQL